VEENANKLHF